MKTPIVSIIMSTYNNELYIAQSIESVLRQTYIDWEFIIVNDSSTDSTLAMINQFARRDKRFIVISNKRNKGLVLNLLEGVKRAKGEFIARIDGDDIWADTDKLTKQIDFLQQHPHYDLVGSYANIIDQKGTILLH